MYGHRVSEYTGRHMKVGEMYSFSRDYNVLEDWYIGFARGTPHRGRFRYGGVLRAEDRIRIVDTDPPGFSHFGVVGQVFKGGLPREGDCAQGLICLLPRAWFRGVPPTYPGIGVGTSPETEKLRHMESLAQRYGAMRQRQHEPQDRW